MDEIDSIGSSRLEGGSGGLSSCRVSCLYALKLILRRYPSKKNMISSGKPLMFRDSWPISRFFFNMPQNICFVKYLIVFRMIVVVSYLYKLKGFTTAANWQLYVLYHRQHLFVKSLQAVWLTMWHFCVKSLNALWLMLTLWHLFVK